MPNWFDQFAANLGNQVSPFGFAPTPGMAPSQDNPAYQAGINTLGDVGFRMLANSSRPPMEALGQAYTDAQAQARSNSKEAFAAQQMMSEAEANRQKRQQEEEQRKKKNQWLQSISNPNTRAMLEANPELIDNYVAATNPAFVQPTANMRDYQFAQKNPAYKDFITGGKHVTITDEVAQRKAAAEAQGMKPDDPAYDAYVLTGKMPREDQAPLTATDKQAILQSDDAVMANQMAVDALKSVITPGEDGKSLNEKADYGWTSGIQPWIARNDPTGFTDASKGQATTDLNNIILNQALGSLKATFGAAPTEGERQILLDLQASVDKTPAERESIIKRAIAMAEKRLQFNQQRASSLRGGTYYKNGGNAVNINGYTIEEVPQ